jgi:beta-lactamase regulating signal transducer with metallopeptidase domain
MNGEWAAAGNRVLEALFNGVFQGLIVAGLLWVGLRLLPRANAATRHAAGFAGMLIIAALPLLHLAESFWVPGVGGTGSIGSGARNGPEIRHGLGWGGGTPPHEPKRLIDGEPPRPGPLPQGGEGEDLRTAVQAKADHLRQFERPHREVELTHASSMPSGSESLAFLSPLEGERAGVMGDPDPQPNLDGVEASKFSIEQWQSWVPVVGARFLERKMPDWKLPLRVEIALAVLGAWLLVSAWYLVDLARQCVLLRAMKKRAHEAPDELRTRFEVLRGEMRVGRKVGLALCKAARTPIAAGFRKPLVLLPARLGDCERPARLDGILRHELAHVHRRDDWTNLVQQIIHAVFFFHPGVCWLSRRLSVEREIACDDHAIAAIASRRDYALLLAEFGSRMQSREWAAAPGAWSRKGQLKERINMILNAKRNASTRLAGASAGMFTVGAALIALLVMQAGPRVAFADEGQAEARASVDAAPAVEAVPAVAAIHSGGSAVSVVSGARSKPGAVLHAVPPVAPMLATASPAPAMDPPRPPRPPRPAAGSRDRSLEATGRDGNLFLGQRPAAGPRDRGLEERLERLERMVEQLTGDRKEGRNKDANFNFDSKHEWHHFDPKFHEQMEKQFNFKFKQEEMDRIHEHARRSAEQGAKEAKNAAKEAERMAKEMARKGEFGTQVRVETHIDLKPLKEEKKALENQRKALEKQLQAIERQLDAMERQEDHAEEAREREEEAREREEEAREREEENRERREKLLERVEIDRQKSTDDAANTETLKKRAR